LANLLTKPIPQLVLFLALAAPCSSQTRPTSPPPADPAVAGVNLPEAPCDEPAPLPGIEDYRGPFNKVAVVISRKLEVRTVHRPDYKAGARLCSLDAREKFQLFVEDNFEPISFVAAGFDAGIAQAGDDDPTFGQGAAGYGKRYGVALTDNISDGFFRTFLFPALLHEDPRYYRQLHGSVPRRLAHAMRHVFVARRDSGQLMFNFSEWLGTASARSLSNLYHPGNHRGFQPTARGVAFSIGTDMGVDILREFWPEIARRLRLPFRAQDHPHPGHS